jgi:hypothetical protein
LAAGCPTSVSPRRVAVAGSTQSVDVSRQVIFPVR